MEVIALKSFISTTYGQVNEGQKLPVSDSMARNWIKAGMVQCYETKVIVNQPVVPVIQEPVIVEPIPSSPPVQVSKKKTAKKRGKKRK